MSKVSMVKCEDYNSDRVVTAIFHSIELLGGAGAFIKRGDRVLIKPNLLSPRDPEEAVCTHPEVVRAAIRLVKKAEAEPLVGDSPGSFFTYRDVYSVYEKTGIKRIADEEKVELVRFDKSRIINGYPIAEQALNTSLILSLPKLKTHAFTVMTGGIKNTFGMVPGLYKVECHKNKPKPKDFVKTLLDIFEIVKPGLSIMDGVLAMEGDGPAAGNPRHVGLILASPDAVSLDAVVAELITLPDYKDIIVNEARIRKAGEADIERIEIVGETIENVRIKDFKLPKSSGRINMLPDFVANTLSKLLDFKPVIDEELCNKCNVCKNSCPADAITINEEKSRIDNRICIRCFCCHEVCSYKAIYIKRNFFANLLWRE